jgi:DNA-3-methyladenine glycosylase
MAGTKKSGRRVAAAKPGQAREKMRGLRSALPGELVARSFFEAPPDRVAPALLGKLLVFKSRLGLLAGRIVEVEAYLGPHSETPDAAAHTYRGPTPRNAVMFGPAGHAYVYAIYGRYFCANVSCEAEGQGAGVLIRALEPVTGMVQMARNRGLEAEAAAKDLTSGPSRLCQALGLTRELHNGLCVVDENSILQVRDDGFKAGTVLATPRIGINPANPALEWPLRYVLAGHPCVSGPRRMRG